MTLSVRPPSDDDRELLLGWRNDDRVRRVSLTEAPITDAVHDEWFEGVLIQQPVRFLVVSWTDAPVGVAQVGAIDPVANTGSWSCHLGDISAPPGVGPSLPLIALALGFDGRKLRRMWAEVLGLNKGMLSIHRRLRIPHEGTSREHVVRDNGDVTDVEHFGVLEDEWESIRENGLRLFPSQMRTSLESLFAELSENGLR